MTDVYTAETLTKFSLRKRQQAEKRVGGCCLFQTIVYSYFPQFMVFYWKFERISSEGEFRHLFHVSNLENVIFVVVHICVLEKTRGFNEKIW